MKSYCGTDRKFPSEVSLVDEEGTLIKKVKCKLCGREWYLEDGEESFLKVCPFCCASVKEKQKIEKKRSRRSYILCIVGTRI